MTKYILIIFLLAGCNSSSDYTNKKSMNEKNINWENTATPGPFHQKLNVLIGEWDFTGNYWPNGSDQPPAVDKGTAKAEWINDGRFVQLKGKGTQMQAPFSFVSLIGYNNIRKEYTSVWSDNSTTAMFSTTGLLNETGNQVIFFGNSDDPFEKVLDKRWKVILTFENKGGFQFDYYDISGTTELRLFVLSFQKKEL